MSVVDEFGRYSRVSRRVWNDAAFRALSPMPPSGAGLFLRLLTGPELSCIPGLFQAWEGGLAQALRWSLADLQRCLKEITDGDLARVDRDAGLVWLPNGIRHNEPHSPNVILSWRVAWTELPDCELKVEAAAGLMAWAEEKGKAWSEAMSKVVGKPSRKASPKGEGKPSAKPAAVIPPKGEGEPLRHPSSNQDQDQDQEQEIPAAAEDPKDLTGSAREEARPESAPSAAAIPRNLEEALKIPICERAKLIDSRPDLAQWLQPEAWSEVKRLVKAFEEATGKPSRRGAYDRDGGIRALVALYSVGYMPSDLERAIRATVASDWWTKDGVVRGLQSFSIEVVEQRGASVRVRPVAAAPASKWADVVNE